MILTGVFDRVWHGEDAGADVALEQMHDSVAISVWEKRRKAFEEKVLMKSLVDTYDIFCWLLSPAWTETSPMLASLSSTALAALAELTLRRSFSDVMSLKSKYSALVSHESKEDPCQNQSSDRLPIVL